MQDWEIIKLAEMLGSEWKRSGSSVQLSCPNVQSPAHGGKDHHPSFGIKASDATSVCNCFTCNLAGSVLNVFQLLYAQGVVSQTVLEFVQDCEQLDFAAFGRRLKQRRASVLSTVLKKPSELQEVIASLDQRACDDYYYSRGLTPTEIQRWRLGYDSDRIRAVFPVVLPTGEVVGGAGRALGGGHPKYYKYAADYTALFGEQFVDRDRQELVLVEGPLDAIIASRVLSNVCALQGLSLSWQKIQRIRKYADSVTLLFDSDCAGQAGVAAVGAKLCRKLRVFVATLPYGDPAETPLAMIYAAFSRRIIYHRSKFF